MRANLHDTFIFPDQKLILIATCSFASVQSKHLGQSSLLITGITLLLVMNCCKTSDVFFQCHSQTVFSKSHFTDPVGIPHRNMKIIKNPPFEHF